MKVVKVTRCAVGSASTQEHERERGGEQKEGKPEESGSTLLALLEWKKDSGFTVMA